MRCVRGCLMLLGRLAGQLVAGIGGSGSRHLIENLLNDLFGAHPANPLIGLEEQSVAQTRDGHRFDVVRNHE